MARREGSMSALKVGDDRSPWNSPSIPLVIAEAVRARISRSSETDASACGKYGVADAMARQVMINDDTGPTTLFRSRR